MAAAAHLVKRNKGFILIEKGEEIGVALLQWKHVRLFSPWEYTIDRAAEELLVSHGWTSPPKEELPTGGDMVRDYLQPLAELPEMKPHIVTGGRVIAIQRYGIDKMKTKGRETFPFEVIYEKEGEIHRVFTSGLIDATQAAVIEGVDEIIVNTGARPDFSYIRELRYHADHALECVPDLTELIDPNVHSCGTVRAHGEAELRQPERNFYVVGSKSYGRAPTFLMATGYEQVRSIAAAFAGDWEAASKVELHLPETGVCRVPESKDRESVNVWD